MISTSPILKPTAEGSTTQAQINCHRSDFHRSLGTTYNNKISYIFTLLTNIWYCKTNMVSPVRSIAQPVVESPRLDSQEWHFLSKVAKYLRRNEYTLLVNFLGKVVKSMQ